MGRLGFLLNEIATAEYREHVLYVRTSETYPPELPRAERLPAVPNLRCTRAIVHPRFTARNSFWVTQPRLAAATCDESASAVERAPTELREATANTAAARNWTNCLRMKEPRGRSERCDSRSVRGWTPLRGGTPRFMPGRLRGGGHNDSQPLSNGHNPWMAVPPTQQCRRVGRHGELPGFGWCPGAPARACRPTRARPRQARSRSRSRRPPATSRTAAG